MAKQPPGPPMTLGNIRNSCRRYSPKRAVCEARNVDGRAAVIGDLTFNGGRTMKSSRWLIVSRHARAPAKALGASCLALWTVAIAVAATPAIADEAPNRIRIEYAPPKSQNYQPPGRSPEG